MEPTNIQFRLAQTTMTGLWDFGWFDVSTFEISPAPEGRDGLKILEAFFRDPISQRSLCDQESWGVPVGRHGPFLHQHFRGEWVRPIALAELKEDVTAVLEDPEFTGPPSLEQRAPVEAWLARVVKRKEHVWKLLESDSTVARVDWHWIWLLYHEYISLSPDFKELTIAVIGYD